MAETNTMLAGYSRVDITPDYSVSLSGYGNDETRFQETVRDPIYLTCVAITGENDTILLVVSDTLSVSHELAEDLRARITPVTGVPGEKIFFTATHTHSAPLLYGDHKYRNVDRFRKDYFAAAERCAKEAMEDRAPARMLTGCKRVPGMNFIRHHLLEDGTYKGPNFNDSPAQPMGHAGMTDPRMLLLQLQRQDKEDIVIMNWQAHNDNVGDLGQPVISSSYTGCVRERFEQLTGMRFAFMGGASGNQIRGSKIPGESHGLDWIAYSYRLAEIAADQLPTLTPVAHTRIQTLRVDFPCEIDHSWDDQVAKAQEVFDLWKATDNKQGNAMARSVGFSSIYQTCAILHRVKLGKYGSLELNAFTIGDIAFITGTFEMFSDTGIYVRAYAPYETVFICTGNNTYVPSATSYDYRSYEADTSLFVKGTCEKVSREYVRMLEQLKNR